MAKAKKPRVSASQIHDGWEESIGAAMDRRGRDRDELAALLRWYAQHGRRPVPPDALEFLAWLVEEKAKEDGRPILPAKFKELKAIVRDTDLYNALCDFRAQREEWKAKNPRRKFPYKVKLEEVANEWGIDQDKLDNALRRGKVPT
jgi:hypothetical protein